MNRARVWLVTLFMAFGCSGNLAAEEIRLVIPSEDQAVAGTLLLPEGDTTQMPLVILISGSGAQSRDSEVFGFPLFARLAEELRQAGIATFRYDDRQTGESGGVYSEATLDRLAADVAVIVDHFKVFSPRRFAEIILLGHSQGGVVAGRLAVLDARIDRVILMASTGKNMRRVLRDQVAAAYAQNALPAELVEAEILAREQIMYAIADEEDVDAAAAAYAKVYLQVLQQLPREMRAQIPDLEAFASNQATQLVAAFDTPLARSLIFHDPVTDLEGLKMPVLMLFGGRDSQVDASIHGPLMEAALTSAGSPFVSMLLPDANHLFQSAVTGQVTEYPTLPHEFTPGFVDSIAQWIMLPLKPVP